MSIRNRCAASSASIGGMSDPRAGHEFRAEDQILDREEGAIPQQAV